MNMNITPGAFRGAVYPTLWLSLPGLMAVSSLMLGLKDAFKLAASFPVQIAVGYVGMVLVIEFVGIPWRAKLDHFGAGVPFAILLFIAGVLSGSASSMLVYRDFDFVPCVLGPLFWMGFYGVLPAAVFGVIGTSLLRKRAADAEGTAR